MWIVAIALQMANCLNIRRDRNIKKITKYFWKRTLNNYIEIVINRDIKNSC